MKQQIISGLKKKLLLVELPGGANRVQIFHDKDRPYISYFTRGGDTGRFYLNGDVELIGKLTDIKEEQFAELVENIKAESTWYINYKESVICNNCFDTAKESFFSKLEKDGIYFENHIPHFSHNLNSGDKESFWYNLHKSQWQEAQEKVWDINNCWLFEIL